MGYIFGWSFVDNIEVGITVKEILDGSNTRRALDVNITGGTVNATIDESSLAKDATLTGGSAKTQIVDSSDANLGNTANPLVTQEKSPISGFATSAKQGQLANNVTSIINNATFNATITSSDIDFSKYAVI